MNPAVSLCDHLRADDLARLSIDPSGVLDWFDGPITAIAQCPRCDGLGLLELLDWSRSHRLRIYALAGIDRAAVTLFHHNRERGSCDLSRAEREVLALFASAGAVERVIALHVDGNAVLATAPRPPGLFLPDAPWRERLLQQADASWFTALGLEKSTA
jgi:hypothetical protein